MRLKIRFILGLVLTSVALAMLFHSKKINDATLEAPGYPGVDSNHSKRQVLDTLVKQVSNIVRSQSWQEKALKSSLMERLDALQTEMEKLFDMASAKEPTLMYEETRRQVWQYLDQLFQVIRSQSSLSTSKSERRSGLEQKVISLWAEFYKFREHDGFQSWRQSEFQNLTNLVQTYLARLNNPGECTDAKFLLCSLEGCGFGCQIHHSMTCLLTALGSGRIMKLKSRQWRYERVHESLVPIGYNCSLPYKLDHFPSWVAKGDESYVQVLSFTGALDLYNNKRPILFDRILPQELAPRLKRLFQDPVAWWISQLAIFLFQLQDGIKAEAQKRMRKLGLKPKGYAALHIRRTDKFKEAEYHDTGEYIEALRYYFQLQEAKEGVKIRTKLVYLATDDSRILEQCRKKYPEFTFVANPGFANLAGIDSRYTKNALDATIIDVHLLSQADFVVCTLSSNICRLVLELMHQYHINPMEHVKSLDWQWVFYNMDMEERVVLRKHDAKKKEEMSVQEGDIIRVDLKLKAPPGYIHALNIQTRIQGLIPAFKAKAFYNKTINMPLFGSDSPQDQVVG